MAKKGSVRRYFGRKRRSAGKMTVPIMGVLDAAALVVPVLTKSSGGNPNDNPIYYMTHGDAGRTGKTLTNNLSDPRTYVPFAIVTAGWILGKALLGKRKISKHVSMF